MLGLKATRIVVAEADIAQLVLEVTQIGEYLLLRGRVMVVHVTSPWALAGIAAAIRVAATHAALVIPADVPALAVLVPVPLDAVGPSRRGSDDIDLIDEVGGILYTFIPCAQTALVVGDHILHRARAGSLVGADEVDELALGPEIALGRPQGTVDVVGLAASVIEIEDRHEAHTVRVVDDVTIVSAHP